MNSINPLILFILLFMLFILVIHYLFLYLFIDHLFSFIYLPFPLNYYYDQLRISKEYRQLATNPFHNWLNSFLYNADSEVGNTEKAIRDFKSFCHLKSDSNQFTRRFVNYNDSSYDNVILIVMESFGANRIGIMNGKKKLSPNFDSLCKDGILFSKCFERDGEHRRRHDGRSLLGAGSP